MKLQVSSNVREIRNWACKQPEMTNLLAHPYPLYPAPPSPSYHCVPVERKDVRVSSVRVPGRTLINPLFLNGLQRRMHFHQEDDFHSNLYIMGIQDSGNWLWINRGRDRETERVTKSPLAWSKIPGVRGGGGTWINFCGVPRTPSPLANYILASHVFRGGTKYEVP